MCQRGEADPTGESALAAALWQQGPPPASVVLANARRSYQIVAPNSDDDVSTILESCSDDTRARLCHAPTSVAHLRLPGCSLDIDDAHRRVVVTGW